MRATRILLLLGALALAAPALAAAAVAKPGYIRFPPSFSFQLQLPGADGYGLEAASVGHGRFVLSARKGSTWASYSARGFANRRRLHVDLGRFGRIDVRFAQRSAQRFKPPDFEPPFTEDCHGRRSWRLRGLATGTIRFRGLNGFAAIDKRRAKASVERSSETVCKQGGGSFYAEAVAHLRGRRAPDGAGVGGFEPKIDSLSAQARIGDEWVGFEASRFFLFGGIPEMESIVAYTMQRIDGVRLLNWAHGSPRPGELQISRRGVHPASARVEGSGPFSGESTYRRLPGGGSEWSGSLRVRLPGEGTVRLSGAGFDAEICHETLRGGVAAGCRPQSSGSHSQSLFDARLSWSR